MKMNVIKNLNKYVTIGDQTEQEEHQCDMDMDFLINIRQHLHFYLLLVGCFVLKTRGDVVLTYVVSTGKTEVARNKQVSVNVASSLQISL